MTKSLKGFTLIELLIVIVIIGILSTGAVALFTNAQRNARDAKRQADLTQLATAVQVYATENNSQLPADMAALVSGGYLQKAVTTPRGSDGDGTAEAGEEIYCYYSNPTTGQFGFAAWLEGDAAPFTSGSMSAAAAVEADFVGAAAACTAADATPTMTAAAAVGAF